MSFVRGKSGLDLLRYVAEAKAQVALDQKDFESLLKAVQQVGESMAVRPDRLHELRKRQVSTLAGCHEWIEDVNGELAKGERHLKVVNAFLNSPAARWIQEQDNEALQPLMQEVARTRKEVEALAPKVASTLERQFGLERDLSPSQYRILGEVNEELESLEEHLRLLELSPKDLEVLRHQSQEIHQGIIDSYFRSRGSLQKAFKELQQPRQEMVRQAFFEILQMPLVSRPSEEALEKHFGEFIHSLSILESIGEEDIQKKIYHHFCRGDTWLLRIQHLKSAIEHIDGQRSEVVFDSLKLLESVSSDAAYDGLWRMVMRHWRKCEHLSASDTQKVLSSALSALGQAILQCGEDICCKKASRWGEGGLSIILVSPFLLGQLTVSLGDELSLLLKHEESLGNILDFSSSRPDILLKFARLLEALPDESSKKAWSTLLIHTPGTQLSTLLERAVELEEALERKDKAVFESLQVLGNWVEAGASYLRFTFGHHATEGSFLPRIPLTVIDFWSDLRGYWESNRGDSYKSMLEYVRQEQWEGIIENRDQPWLRQDWNDHCEQFFLQLPDEKEVMAQCLDSLTSLAKEDKGIQGWSRVSLLQPSYQRLFMSLLDLGGVYPEVLKELVPLLASLRHPGIGQRMIEQAFQDPEGMKMLCSILTSSGDRLEEHCHLLFVEERFAYFRKCGIGLDPNRVLSYLEQMGDFAGGRDQKERARLLEQLKAQGVEGALLKSMEYLEVDRLEALNASPLAIEALQQIERKELLKVDLGLVPADFWISRVSDAVGLIFLQAQGLEADLLRRVARLVQLEKGQVDASSPVIDCLKGVVQAGYLSDSLKLQLGDHLDEYLVVGLSLLGQEVLLDEEEGLDRFLSRYYPEEEAQKWRDGVTHWLHFFLDAQGIAFSVDGPLTQKMRLLPQGSRVVFLEHLLLTCEKPEASLELAQVAPMVSTHRDYCSLIHWSGSTTTPHWDQEFNLGFLAQHPNLTRVLESTRDEFIEGILPSIEQLSQCSSDLLNYVESLCDLPGLFFQGKKPTSTYQRICLEWAIYEPELLHSLAKLHEKYGERYCLIYQTNTDHLKAILRMIEECPEDEERIVAQPLPSIDLPALCMRSPKLAVRALGAPIHLAKSPSDPSAQRIVELLQFSTEEFDAAILLQFYRILSLNNPNVMTGFLERLQAMDYKGAFLLADMAIAGFVPEAEKCIQRLQEDENDPLVRALMGSKHGAFLANLFYLEEHEPDLYRDLLAVIEERIFDPSPLIIQLTQVAVDGEKELLQKGLELVVRSDSLSSQEALILDFMARGAFGLAAELLESQKTSLGQLGQVAETSLHLPLYTLWHDLSDSLSEGEAAKVFEATLALCGEVDQVEGSILIAKVQMALKHQPVDLLERVGDEKLLDLSWSPLEDAFKDLQTKMEQLAKQEFLDATMKAPLMAVRFCSWAAGFIVTASGGINREALLLVQDSNWLTQYFPLESDFVQGLSRLTQHLVDQPEYHYQMQQARLPKGAGSPAERMLRKMLGKPEGNLDKVDVAQAVISTLLSHPRQGDIGSCFGTRFAIQMHQGCEENLQALREYQSLISEGGISRIRSKGQGTRVYPLQLDSRLLEADPLLINILLASHEAVISSMGGSGDYSMISDSMALFLAENYFSPGFVISEYIRKRLPVHSDLNVNQVLGTCIEVLQEKLSARLLFDRMDPHTGKRGQWSLFIRESNTQIETEADYIQSIKDVLEDARQVLVARYADEQEILDLIFDRAVVQLSQAKFLSSPLLGDTMLPEGERSVTPWVQGAGGFFEGVFQNYFQSEDLVPTYSASLSDARQVLAWVQSYCTAMSSSQREAFLHESDRLLFLEFPGHALSLSPGKILQNIGMNIEHQLFSHAFDQPIQASTVMKVLESVSKALPVGDRELFNRFLRKQVEGVNTLGNLAEEIQRCYRKLFRESIPGGLGAAIENCLIDVLDSEEPECKAYSFQTIGDTNWQAAHGWNCNLAIGMSPVTRSLAVYLTFRDGRVLQRVPEMELFWEGAPWRLVVPFERQVSGGWGYDGMYVG